MIYSSGSYVSGQDEAETLVALSLGVDGFHIYPPSHLRPPASPSARLALLASASVTLSIYQRLHIEGRTQHSR